jgi:hypothetical protein
MALIIPQSIVFEQCLSGLFFTLTTVNNSFNDSYSKIGMQNNSKLG